MQKVVNVYIKCGNYVIDKLITQLFATVISTTVSEYDSKLHNKFSVFSYNKILNNRVVDASINIS